MTVKILIVVVTIIAIPLVVALFMKKEYIVEREIFIKKPRQEVFNYVKCLKNQDSFSKWIMIDPEIKKEFKGADGTVGFVYAWDSDNKDVGKWDQEIKSITEGEKIEYEIRFIKPFEGVGTTHLSIESISEDQTKVKWGMKGKNTYPFNLMNLFIGNMLGKDLETSLTTLKHILEDQ